MQHVYTSLLSHIGFRIVKSVLCNFFVDSQNEENPPFKECVILLGI